MPSSMQGTVGVPTVDEAKRLATLLGLLRVTTSEEQAGTTGASEDKLEWLRSQLIGKNIEFDTPFGRRMLTYADQTASGRSLRYIEDYLVKDVLPFYGNTHTEDSHVGSKTTRLVHKAARYIKRCMSAGPNDVLIFCGSGTTAAIKRLQEVIGVAAPSVELRGRLSTQLQTEERWAHRHCCTRTCVSSPEYKNRPMLGSFSACSNVTGIMTDTREIARVLHQHGAYACFDFAASDPYVKIDMKSGEIDGYDAVFLSPHKFVGGPGTPGILLMNKGLYKLSSQPPSLCGGGTVAYVNGFSEEDTIYYDDIEEREDAGTPPIVQKIRTSLAFWVKEYIGYDRMGLHERVYSETAMKRLVSNPNIWVLGNTNVERLPIFSFLIYPPVKDSLYNIVDQPSSDRWLEDVRRKRQPLHGRFVTRLFNDLFGIQARGGCACAGPYGHTLLKIENDLSLRLRSAILQGYSGLKPGWTRLSFSYYLSKEEFKFILSAIEFIASYGHRFLPLYEFDWITGNWTFKKEAIKYLLMKEELALATGLDHLTENDLFKDEAKIEKKPRAIRDKFESYLESAKIIALSLPDIKQPTVSVPKGVDPDLVLFYI
ncbi:hypothetical protein QOZ80_UnG0729180 [Eleusine coracana subsp. coracana]|uniref:Aminotransferase class V domain-containing protein n=1 Tax=Eleusine coracana subsp. coracana TaxID=191504 RepID=A0AAV9G3S1_ELECO|nr:hypothetical protein QOZ80_UnG0729180 [Eleusine coracana subsp. coracana]